MREVETRAVAAYWDAFDARPTTVASAPGRINLIGEHTDYNEGFVLPIAIDLRIALALGHGTEGLYSSDFSERRPSVSAPGGSWADYPNGIVWSLGDAGHEIPPTQMAFAGDVPVGAGLSSSAAIECATALGLNAGGNLGIGRSDLARLCRRAENEFVGVRSGIMDQFASLLSQRDAALFLDCRSLQHRLIPFRPSAHGLTLLVCDTRSGRRLAASGYNERRATCERAARMLRIGSLREAGLDDLGRLSGEELKRARHVISENERVPAAVKALENDEFAAFGELMFESHASLRDDYEVSTPALDAFVETAQAGGALGARLTGAGFGGCAIALQREESAGETMQSVRREFVAKGFREPGFYQFTASDGASAAVIEHPR